MVDDCVTEIALGVVEDYRDNCLCLRDHCADCVVLRSAAAHTKDAMFFSIGKKYLQDPKISVGELIIPRPPARPSHAVCPRQSAHRALATPHTVFFVHGMFALILGLHACA